MYATREWPSPPPPKSISLATPRLLPRQCDIAYVKRTRYSSADDPTMGARAGDTSCFSISRGGQCCVMCSGSPWRRWRIVLKTSVEIEYGSWRTRRRASCVAHLLCGHASETTARVWLCDEELKTEAFSCRTQIRGVPFTLKLSAHKVHAAAAAAAAATFLDRGAV